MQMVLVLLALLVTHQSTSVDEIKMTPFTGIKLSLNGVIVCDEDGLKKNDAALKKQLDTDSKVSDVVKILGPGFISPHSGTGGITWYFSDGSIIFTRFWPLNLDHQVFWSQPETSPDKN